MNFWEYQTAQSDGTKITHIDGDELSEDAAAIGDTEEDFLALAGENGYELATVVEIADGNRKFYLKRPTKR